MGMEKPKLHIEEGQSKAVYLNANILVRMEILVAQRDALVIQKNECLNRHYTTYRSSLRSIMVGGKKATSSALKRITRDTSFIGAGCYASLFFSLVSSDRYKMHRRDKESYHHLSICPLKLFWGSFSSSFDFLHFFYRLNLPSTPRKDVICCSIFLEVQSSMLSVFELSVSFYFCPHISPLLITFVMT